MYEWVSSATHGYKSAPAAHGIAQSLWQSGLGSEVRSQEMSRRKYRIESNWDISILWKCTPWSII